MNQELWHRWMQRALELAEDGRFGASPNPMVGAVVVDPRGEPIGEGAHVRCGGAHAEINALAAAGERARGGTLVVNLEPCSHHGKTPPCVAAVIAAGIQRVVVGCLDPNPLVSGAGVSSLRSAGLDVVVGVEEAACRSLNARFFHWITRGLPFVTLKMAISLDGKLAARGGASRWITGEEARRAGHLLREEYDAILIGVGTVLADNPRLVRHLGLHPDPHLRRVVLDSSLRTPSTSMLLQVAARDTVLFCTPAAAPQRRQELEATGATVVEVAAAGQRCDLWQVVRWLAQHQVSSLLVEGGGEVHWSFLHEGLVQRVHAFLAPLLMGGREAIPAVGGAGFASPQESVRLHFSTIRRWGDDLELVAEGCHV